MLLGSGIDIDLSVETERLDPVTRANEPGANGPGSNVAQFTTASTIGA